MDLVHHYLHQVLGMILNYDLKVDVKVKFETLACTYSKSSCVELVESHL